jgi:hypothetical protein
VSKFLSNPFEYNRFVRPMEVIFKDGRIASLAPAPRKCDFDGLRPAPTSSQSFELEIGLVEHMC